MQKSSSNFNPKPQPKKRPASAPRINIDKFSSHSHQLALLSEELLALNQEKLVLLEYNSQLSKSISDSESESRFQIIAHNNLHTETQSLQASSAKLEQTIRLNKKTTNECIESIQKLDLDINKLKTDKEELEKTSFKELQTVTKLKELIIKLRSDLNFQERDREKYKSEAACSLKQITQLQDKIEALQKSNTNFARKIKQSIKN